MWAAQCRLSCCADQVLLSTSCSQEVRTEQAAVLTVVRVRQLHSMICGEQRSVSNEISNQCTAARMHPDHPKICAHTASLPCQGHLP